MSLLPSLGEGRCNTISTALKSSAPMTSTSQVPILPNKYDPKKILSACQQADMVNRFALNTKMNLDWAEKCLEDNQWDLDRAGQRFNDLKTQGKIPKSAFYKLSVREASAENICCQVGHLSATQQKSVFAMVYRTGMNMLWSQLCLEDNEWDWGRAVERFTDLMMQEKIPEVAFFCSQQEMLHLFAYKNGMNLEWAGKCLMDNEWDWAQAVERFSELMVQEKVPEVAFFCSLQEMLKAFSLKSGLIMELAEKCLQDNEWDFYRAMQRFTDLNSQGQIPDAAFWYGSGCSV